MDIASQQLGDAAFRSPHWEPDYLATLSDGTFGVTSTQRFITPECSQAPMPYRDAVSGCIVTGDLFLTDRERLAGELGCSIAEADSQLVLAAYLKWGDAFAAHLCGVFLITIWDPRQNRLIIATDIHGLRPCLYTYLPSQGFYFANTMMPFREWGLAQDIDPTVFIHFSLDYTHPESTCYVGIKRLLPGHTLVISKGKMRLKRYWVLRKMRFAYKTREDWYVAFREVFEKSVRDMLRATHPITAQISGGLDSSSVAAVAAQILGETSQPLYGLRHYPLDLMDPVRENTGCFTSCP